MTTVNVYLNFDGNCEEAFTFYKSVFGKEFTYLGRFKDIPPQASSQTIDSKHANKILHVSLPISQETILMGCDNIEEEGESYKHGNNFSISITSNSKKEADRLFNALSKDGIIQSPMKDAFWGDYFGQFTDKFGINWIIIAEPSSEKADKTKKVRGIGGIFFKSKDPVKLKNGILNILDLTQMNMEQASNGASILIKKISPIPNGLLLLIIQTTFLLPIKIL